VNNFSRNLMFWMAIGILLMFLFNVFQTTQKKQAGTADMMAYSDFMAEAAGGRISDIVIKGSNVTGHYTGTGKEFSVLIPENENVVERLNGTGVRITAEKEDAGEDRSALAPVPLNWFPMLLLIGVWIFFMRQMQSKGGGGAMGFGKSRARRC
jgi:cell division protease FtsH